MLNLIIVTLRVSKFNSKFHYTYNETEGVFVLVFFFLGKMDFLKMVTGGFFALP